METSPFLFEFFAPLRHDFCSLSLDDYVSVRVAIRGLKVQARDLCSVSVGKALEACCRIDDAASAYVDELVAVLERVLDFVHIQGRLAEEYDVWAHGASANGALGLHRFFSRKFEFVFVLDATELHQVAVHVQHALAASTFVEVVNVLRHEQEFVAEALFELGKRDVRRIRFVFGEAFAQEVVEVLDAFRVTAEGFRRADVFDVLVFPHSVVSAERAKSGFGTDAGTSQDD